MVKYTIHVARGPVARFMRRCGWAGVTIPLRRAHVVMWGEPDMAELRHELAHVDQIARLGRLRWLATILGQYVRHGHKRAPLEVEARRAAGQDE